MAQGYFHCVEILLQRGADIHVRDEVCAFTEDVDSVPLCLHESVFVLFSLAVGMLIISSGCC